MGSETLKGCECRSRCPAGTATANSDCRLPARRRVYICASMMHQTNPRHIPRQTLANCNMQLPHHLLMTRCTVLVIAPSEQTLTLTAVICHDTYKGLAPRLLNQHTAAQMSWRLWKRWPNSMCRRFAFPSVASLWHSRASAVGCSARSAWPSSWALSSCWMASSLRCVNCSDNGDAPVRVLDTDRVTRPGYMGVHSVQSQGAHTTCNDCFASVQAKCACYFQRHGNIVIITQDGGSQNSLCTFVCAKAKQQPR